MQGLAIGTAMFAALVLAAPAAAQEAGDTRVDFTLGRVVRPLPDRMDRIGIRSTCAEAGGCTIQYTLMHGARSLGGGQFMLIGNTTETDNITLSKRTAATLRKRRWVVTVIAKVTDLADNEATYTKVVTLGPKKKKPKRR